MADKKKDDAQREAEEFAATQPQPRSMAVPGNDLSGYLGTAPEYQNYADPTHKPLLTDDERWRFTPMTDEEVEAAQRLREETASKELGNDGEPDTFVVSDLSEAGQAAKDRSEAQAAEEKRSEDSDADKANEDANRDAREAETKAKPDTTTPGDARSTESTQAPAKKAAAPAKRTAPGTK